MSEAGRTFGVWREKFGASGAMDGFQTPAWECPLEPHFRFPIIHWFARPTQARLLSLIGRFRGCSIVERRKSGRGDQSSNQAGVRLLVSRRVAFRRATRLDAEELHGLVVTAEPQAATSRRLIRGDSCNNGGVAVSLRRRSRRRSQSVDRFAAASHRRRRSCRRLPSRGRSRR